MEGKSWIRVMMYWSEKLETPQIAAHNKLYFSNIVSPMRYKVYARQPFLVTSLRMTRSKLLWALKFSGKFLTLVLRGRRRVHLVQYHKQRPKIMLDWNHATCWHLSKHYGNIWLSLYSVLMKIVHLVTLGNLPLQ